MDLFKLNFTILDLELFSLLSIRSGEKFSQREAAKIIGVSPTAIGNSVKNLEKKGLIRVEKIKNINLISFNRNNKKAIQIKRIENMKNIYNSGLADFLEEKLAGSTIILFGSYSKGEDLKHSDIDIAIIGHKTKNLDLKPYEKELFRKINLNFYKSWNEINPYLRNNILSGIFITGGADL